MAMSMFEGKGRRGDRLRVAVWCTAALLLLLPALAMQVFPKEEVNWTGRDFIAMGMMLSAACGIYELGVRNSRSSWYRAGMGLAALAAFLLLWINLAVGIIGDEHDSANWLFVGVLAVGVVGALVVRFRAAGMAAALAATAIVQAVVAAIAYFISPSEQPEGWILSTCFTALWLGSAALFRKAALLADAGPERAAAG